MLPGDKIAVLANNDSAYRAAAALSKAGATIVAIVDLRQDISEACRKLALECGAEICSPATRWSAPKAARS